MASGHMHVTATCIFTTSYAIRECHTIRLLTKLEKRQLRPSDGPGGEVGSVNHVGPPDPQTRQRPGNFPATSLAHPTKTLTFDNCPFDFSPRPLGGTFSCGLGLRHVINKHLGLGVASTPCRANDARLSAPSD